MRDEDEGGKVCFVLPQLPPLLPPWHLLGTKPVLICDMLEMVEELDVLRIGKSVWEFCCISFAATLWGKDSVAEGAVVIVEEEGNDAVLSLELLRASIELRFCWRL